MDIITILIMASIVVSTLLMIIGPILEFRGKIFFLESKHAPVTSKRYGMWIMTLGAVMFIGGCVLRSMVRERTRPRMTSGDRTERLSG